MTTDEKLAAILAAVQTDPGNRGLARDPHDNLFTATAGQFQAACRSIAEHPAAVVAIFTGFWIPTATPPAFETDGPPGTWWLALALRTLNIPVRVYCEPEILEIFDNFVGFNGDEVLPPYTHIITCERPGPTRDGTFRTMRRRDITSVHETVHRVYTDVVAQGKPVTIGIGDGGNEIGMGSISTGTMVKNIADGDAIRCIVTVDFLVVAGVSNWGAFAIAAGVHVLKGRRAGFDQFSPKRHLSDLKSTVDLWHLVDGVTGRQEATVDGLPWDVYAAPLLRIREILELP